MVEVAVPGERWEAEFFADGEVAVEVFRSAGMEGEEALARLWADHTDTDRSSASKNVCGSTIFRPGKRCRKVRASSLSRVIRSSRPLS